MTPPARNPNEARYVQRMTAHRRGLVRRWPLVFVALGAAIAIGLVSPDRSKPDAAPASIATSVK